MYIQCAKQGKIFLSEHYKYYDDDDLMYLMYGFLVALYHTDTIPIFMIWSEQIAYMANCSACPTVHSIAKEKILICI